MVIAGSRAASLPILHDVHNPMQRDACAKAGASPYHLDHGRDQMSMGDKEWLGAKSAKNENILMPATTYNYMNMGTCACANRVSIYLSLGVLARICSRRGRKKCVGDRAGLSGCRILQVLLKHQEPHGNEREEAKTA